MNKINFIKALVFALTFAIFFGLVVMASVITRKNKKISEVTVGINNEINLKQPLGSSIQSVLSKDNYLYIVVSGGNLSDRVVIVDTNNGDIISSIGLN